MYHIPPPFAWDATRVCRALRERGLSARVEADNVVIVFQRSGVFRFVEYFVPRSRPALTLEYRRDCVIDPIKVHCHPRVPFDYAIQRIEATLRDFGYLQLFADITVREIAENTNQHNPELQRALDVLDAHQSNYRQGAANGWAFQREKLLTEIETFIHRAATS